MAATLKIQVILGYTDGNTTVSKNLTKTLTLAGSNYTGLQQNIGTTEEQVAVVDVGTVGVVFVYNDSDTNYVEVGTATGAYTVKIGPKEFYPFRVNGNSIYAKANTASCKCEFLVFPN